MIFTNIIGGLGNQMFQYACGRAFSVRNNVSLALCVDQFQGYGLHNGYELGRVFRCSPRISEPCELRALLGWQAGPLARKLLAHAPLKPLRHKDFIAEPHFHYWSGLERPLSDAYLHGYWQSERYFAHAAAQIREDFQFHADWDDLDLAVRERMQIAPSLSLHVRRGDYLSKKNSRLFAACDLDYYRRAIRHVREHVPGVRLFVFSDSPDWVEQHLQREFGSLEIVRHNNGARSALDMRLMSCADHHIIANSSFSWWGAWLNPSPNKIVVAPRRWFRDEASISSNDIIPQTWTQI